MDVFENRALLSYPESEREHVYGRKETHEIPFCQPLQNLTITLPLPQITTEWGVAQLILRIKMPNLLVLLQLLLLERSVLGTGERYEEVISCAFALLELLKPYTWQGVFIPQLSEDMMDFICSPVPFIAGAARRMRSKNQVVFDDRVECEIRN